MEGIYLIHTREMITTNKSIYKIGRSHNIINRINQYPRGSNVLFIMMCKKSIECESYLINLFKTKFIHSTYYGREYFEGDKNLIIREIFTYIDSINSIDDSNELQKAKEIAIEEVKIEEDKILKEKKEAKDIEDATIEKDNILKEQNNKILKRYKGKKQTTYCCPKCKDNFKYPSLLIRHLYNSVRCLSTNEYINNIFEQINNQEEIKIDITNNTKPLMFICNYCNSNFKYKTSLYKHKRISKCSQQYK